jgi:hypothetical protein
MSALSEKQEAAFKCPASRSGDILCGKVEAGEKIIPSVIV